MSYTPEDQLISDLAQTAADALDAVQAPIKERLQSRDWNDEHLEELSSLLVDITALQVRLYKVAGENR